MANYLVEGWVSAGGSVEDVMALLCTKLETIVDSKTIRKIDIIQLGTGIWKAVLVYDT